MNRMLHGGLCERKLAPVDSRHFWLALEFRYQFRHAIRAAFALVLSLWSSR